MISMLTHEAAGVALWAGAGAGAGFSSAQAPLSARASAKPRASGETRYKSFISFSGVVGEPYDGRRAICFDGSRRDVEDTPHVSAEVDRSDLHTVLRFAVGGGRIDLRLSGARGGRDGSRGRCRRRRGDRDGAGLRGIK